MSTHSSLTCGGGDCAACAWLNAQIDALRPRPDSERSMSMEFYPDGQPLPYDGFEPEEPYLT